MIQHQEVAFHNQKEIFEKQHEETIEDYETIFICENTDGILDPLERMIYSLNETQIRYGHVTILKNAP
jgi:hypothetical protein